MMAPAPEREIYKPLGDLMALAAELIAKPGIISGGAGVTYEDRLDKIEAELKAISTAKPSRKEFVECATILSICLRKLFLAQRCGDAARVLNYESSIGFFLPFVRRDALEAMLWEREQAKP